MLNVLEANLELTELSKGSINLVVELSAKNDDGDDKLVIDADDKPVFNVLNTEDVPVAELAAVDKNASDELDRGTDEGMAELDEATEDVDEELDTNTPLDDDDDHWESDDGLMNDLVWKT